MPKKALSFGQWRQVAERQESYLQQEIVVSTTSAALG